MRAIRADALPLESEADLEPLLERVGDAAYVLLGEASHGTDEHYRWRAALTRRLLEEKDFSFVAVEGDWPDCYAVHRSVTGAEDAPTDPELVLRGYDRWPTWMWANTTVSEFLRWLRSLNEDRAPERRVGFYGLDVYSLWESLRATLGYLREHQPEDLGPALEAFRCFEPYAEDPQSYARSTRLVPSGCEDEVVGLLSNMLEDASHDDGPADDTRFNAEQNALAAVGAEAYYRSMVRGGSASWNVRDRHMVATLERLMDRYGRDAKAVVWEHNTHVGDARWTDMAAAGMVNVGQLVREQHGDAGVVIVGFGSYQGTVTASDRWGGSTQRMPLPPARQGSTERMLHDALAAMPSALFVFSDPPPAWADARQDHRAVGVVYQAEAERSGNYVPMVVGRRYDAFCWIDQTSALTALPTRQNAQEMETWPLGT